ncbi:MAG TPA: HEPN domain-containing protein [Thermoleophilaceae bacterium]|nr:HEPN domain-containing protein [Thermoleophilaceae bacterium]
MKRRSEEYLGEADRFLGAARVLLEAKLSENSAAEAYQAMFSAARAALSELDREARTHHGTWTLFDQLFIRQDLFERRLRDAARNAEELRYDSDYRLGGASQEEARRVLADAEEFVAAVRAMVH